MMIKKKLFIRRLVGTLAGVAILYSCASVGRIEGGPLDETPPLFLRSTPTPGALNYNRPRIRIEFDEYIKLDNPGEKVVISPPQVQQPNVRASGKRVLIDLEDTLKPNMTYTIDFSDAIVDNNEGNPLGNFAFTFSTGERIDTLEVSGTVLDASNLEPIKGILVGLHADLADSAFVTRPFDRVARTDSRGRFTIRGIAPGTYHAYALQDVDQNFIFSQKSEMIAFSDDSICPSFDFRTRKDTLWLGADSIAIDTIKEVEYTHFMPDNIVLRAFTEQAVTQYMTKNERLVPWKFSLFFAAPADTLPTLEGMNFDAHDAFIVEKSAKNDTIDYWIKDSLVYNIDTLRMRVTYLASDTLNRLVAQTDTLELAPKTTREKIAKEKADIEAFSYNTTVSAFMIAVNELYEQKCNKREILEPLVILLSPFAPHICEELWEALGHRESIAFASFPEYNEAYTVEDTCTYAVSFNGKTRFTVDLSKSMDKEAVEAEVRADSRTAKYVGTASIVKVIVVPGKIVNIVIK